MFPHQHSNGSSSVSLPLIHSSANANDPVGIINFVFLLESRDVKGLFVGLAFGLIISRVFVFTGGMRYGFLAQDHV